MMPGPKPVKIKAQHQCKPLSFSYYIGRLQRIYVFNTNKSWLSMDQFFLYSAIADIRHALFFSEESYYSNTWDALLCIICLMTFWHIFHDL